MISGWPNKLFRLSHMNWDEVRTRAGQELHKWQDLAFFRLGMGDHRVNLTTPPQPPPAFLIPVGEARGRARLLRQSLPEEASAILSEASEICRHRFQLLGYENIDFGRRIDWHSDPLHQKRAPHQPWFKIPFLEFSKVGDHKIIWELNRHQHLVTLAKAWLLNGDENFVRELTNQWDHWQEANPYPLGINWGSSLEVALRSLSWMWLDYLLADCSSLLPEFRSRLWQALGLHGRYIERFLSTYFSPNTHLLGEAVALFYLGTLYPQIPAASRWQQTGWDLIIREAGRQVRPDGVYFEQALYYHVYALDFLLHARLLADCNRIVIPASLDDVIHKMLDVLQALSQVGPPANFGDSDAGRVFNPRRNRTQHLTDPLAIGALLYSRNDLAAARLTEESIWLFGEQAIEQLPLAPGLLTRPSSRAFTSGGIYVLTSAEPVPQQVTIDAGPQGVGRCGHGHADALSICLTMDGRNWLIDPGTDCYISENPADRNLLRGTQAHNTLRVDSLDQAVPEGPFAWTSIPATQVERWITGQSFGFFSGSHNGYTRLRDPVTHCRFVLSLNVNHENSFWLIRDLVLGRQEHNLEVQWHLAPDLAVAEPVRRLFIASPKTTNGGRTGISLAIAVAADNQWKTEITSGWNSPVYGRKEPIAVVRCDARLSLPAEMATLLIPGPGPSPSLLMKGLATQCNASVQAYSFETEELAHYVFFSFEEGTWAIGPWSSDASFLYCGLDGRRLVHIVLIGGSFVQWQRNDVIIVGHAVDFLEWRICDGVVQSSSSLGSTPQPLITELVDTARFRNTASLREGGE
jgi:hypothetical protein